jgi:hypothetical protein
VRLIDTAGMRKKAKVQDKLEKLAVPTACAPSISPKSWCCCSTRRWVLRRRIFASPTACCRRAAR